MKMARYLEKVSGVHAKDLAVSLLCRNEDTETKTIAEYLREDVKSFDIEGYQVIIAQVVIPSCTFMDRIQESIDKALQQYVSEKSCDLVVLVFTSVADNGSCFYLEGKIKDWFVKDFPSHGLMEKLISRKKQIVPLITEIIQNNV